MKDSDLLMQEVGQHIMDYPRHPSLFVEVRDLFPREMSKPKDRQRQIPSLKAIVDLAGHSTGLHMAIRSLVCQLSMLPEGQSVKKELSLLHVDLFLALREVANEEGKSLGAQHTLIQCIEGCLQDVQSTDGALSPRHPSIATPFATPVQQGRLQQRLQ